ncbi:MAG: pectin esterase [Micromonosporaceae bacterium]|nr:pectin esterase [Micromonosporaceae bacterium]
MLAVPAYACINPGLANTTVVTVAADGSGDYSTVQAAVDAVPSGNTEPFIINIKPGVYQGAIKIPSGKPYVTFRGKGRSPSDVVITDNRANGTIKPEGGTYGTSGSASVTISGHDFTAINLTFENAFDEVANADISNKQAVAVLTLADRLIFDNVRFLANQDTLYLNSSNADTIARVYLNRCYVEGDVDFIFGRATAVFNQSTIHSLDKGSTTNNGYVTAPSTMITNPYGFLFVHSKLTSDAPDKTVYLGRPWHPSGNVDAIGSIVFRESWIGAHIMGSPWTDMSGFSWKDARFFEYRTTGPGSAVTDDRPQLTDEQAAEHTPSTYLAGSDNWAPHKSTRRS